MNNNIRGYIMEKLVIKYMQNYDSKEQMEAFKKKIASFGHDIEAATKFGEEYIKDHYVEVRKEYPETVFTNFESMKEVYYFLGIDNNYNQLEVIKVPNSFKRLKNYKANENDNAENSDDLIAEKFGDFGFWLEGRKL